MSDVDRKVVLWLVGGGVNLNCEDMGNKVDKRGLHVLIYLGLRCRIDIDSIANDMCYHVQH